MNKLAGWLVPNLQSNSQRLTDGKLHHGVLLTGIAGIGKTELAQVFAKRLLCASPNDHFPCGECQSCKLFAAGSHPDFNNIESEKQIGVDLIRTAIEKLNSTAQLVGNKVLVINHAETMTESAANALLKTLEEPTPKTYIILVANAANRLLPTILSRCEKQVIATPTSDQSLQWLSEKGFTSVDEGLLRAFSNAPLLVKEALESDSSLSFNEFERTMTELVDDPFGVLGVADKWQEHIGLVIKWCQLLIRNEKSNGLDQAQHRFYVECIEANKKLLHPGVNKNLILSNLLYSWVQLNKG